MFKRGWSEQVRRCWQAAAPGTASRQGLFPAACLPLATAVQAGDGLVPRALNACLQPLWDLFVEHSSLRVVHAAATLMGLCRTLPPRPILLLADEVQRRIAQTLEELTLN